MAADAKREKRRLARLKKVQKEKENLEAEIDDLLEDEKYLLGDEDVVKSIGDKIYVGGAIEQKNMGMVMEMPLPATSFEQLDALEAAREQAEAVREVSWQVQDLVYNILHAMDMNPKQKTAAIKRVGDEFGKRVEKVSSEDSMSKALDLDDLYTKAIEATEKRHKPLLVKLSDWLKKSDLSKEFPVADKWHSALIIEKAADNQWRAVMFPSNNFIDWHGDILSAVAHEEYVEWVNKNMDVAPVFMTWHLAGSARQAPVDFVAYENGFLIMSAPLTDDEAAGLLRLQAETDIGMSHTSLVLARDNNDTHVVTKYRMVEVTDLPLDAAANPFTNLDLVTKEASMDTKTYLATLLNSEEKAENFLKKIGFKQKELTDAEIPSKEKETPAAPVTEPATPDAKVVNYNLSVGAETLTIEQVVERVSKEFGMEELSAQFAKMQAEVEKVPVLESVIKELSKSHEDKLAEMITPPVSKSLSWMGARASQDKATVLGDSKEDETLKKSKPEGGWLSEALGV